MKMWRENRLWHGINKKGESFSDSDFMKVLLWGMGFGKDQVAGLRYEMHLRNKEAKCVIQRNS